MSKVRLVRSRLVRRSGGRLLDIEYEVDDHVRRWSIAVVSTDADIDKMSQTEVNALALDAAKLAEAHKRS